ncbi:MAG: acetyl-CoA synthetase [Akkermansiaceae bacterium]|nr:acetyl-CoA synthetase [Akkermansiaceae bacterium]
MAEEGPEGGWLPPAAVEAVLASCGLTLPRSGVARTADEAAAIAAELGGAVVLKVISDSALHKSDVGGIALDLEGASEVRAAYKSVTEAVSDAQGALVQEFVPGGHEVIIGMTEDPSFGPLILFGLGGIFVELIGDVSFRIHPLTDVDAAEMVREVKTSRLLEGYRGEPVGDVPALEGAILKVSALVEALPEIVEMDLNPVKVLEPGQGVRAVDARIRVRPVTASFIPRRADIPAAEHIRPQR